VFGGGRDIRLAKTRRSRRQTSVQHDVCLDDRRATELSIQTNTDKLKWQATRAERKDSSSDQIRVCYKSTHAIAIFFSFSQGVRLNLFEPSRPNSQSWNRVQSCAFTAYATEMPSFRLRERRCPLLWRGCSPDQVPFCSLGRPHSTGYYTKGGLSPLRC